MPRLYRTIDRSPLTFYVKFDESARYDLNNHNQGDINKLFGFTDCNATVHDDSARFGWRYNTITQLIELFSYVYCNSTVQYSLLGSVKPGEWVKCTIDIGSQYSFILNNTVTVMKRCNNCNTGVYVQLHPYFGGDEVAPHDITIAIKMY